MRQKETVYAVIMAGGGGTRFWPWSREARPKQLLPIVSRKSMIRETVDRLRPMVPPQRILIVTSQLQAAELRREVPEIPAQNVLAEPAGKNTAPCLCLAAAYILKRDPCAGAGAVVMALPADHHIEPGDKFLRTLKAGVRFAGQDLLIALGVKPRAPETGYGYIRKGERLSQTGQIPVYKTRTFREKPTRPRAVQYLRGGDYLWNTGIFVWQVEVFLEAARKFLPDVYKSVMRLAPAIGTPREKRVLEEVYPGIRPVSIDYGIMEKAENVAVVEGRFSWSDIGSWGALGTLWGKDQNGNSIAGDKRRILAIESSGCVVRGEEKLIAVIGVKDLIVVESGNAILVCPKGKSQEVRRVLEELKKRGWQEYI